MKKNINMRLKMFGAIAILFIIVNIVITFAYIRGNSENIESVSTIALEGAMLKVVYSGNSENIVVSDILPGFVASKSFTITSDFGVGNEDGHVDLLYQAMLIVEENDFNDDYIKFSLTADEASDDDGTVMPNVSDVGIATGSNYEGIIIGSGKFYSHNKSHSYTLNISYPDNGLDQTDQIGNKFAAYVVLSKPNLINVTFDLDGGKFTDYGLDENSSKKVAEYASLELPVPIKGGYIFAGWSVVDGRADVRENNLIKFFSESVSLKAVYEQSIYPIFTYLKSDATNANYLLIKDSDYDWRIKFLESGNLVFEDVGNAYFDGIDVFLVGGGAGGGTYAGEYSGVWGGAGGYTVTNNMVSIVSGIQYSIVVGSGGTAGNSSKGEMSSAFDVSASGGVGAKGGSGGGAGGYGAYGSGGNGGSNGSNGGNSGGQGQGTTTREFGEESGTLYAGGGGAERGYTSAAYGTHGAGGAGGGGGYGVAGQTNTGGGGGGRANGGSGIVIIRNAR